MSADLSDAESTIDGVTAFSKAAERVASGSDHHAEARDLVAQMTLDEKLGCLDGDTPFWPALFDMTAGGYYLHPWPAARVERLGIPGIEFADGPRGCVVGDATAFPVSMARGATFDPALEERIGDAIGAELRASGATFTGAVCMNLLRHPAWGRAQETYGEDPHHVGVMAAALTLGLQRHVMACMKHFALNSMENARFTVDVTVDERALHEVYLPHFAHVARSGVASVMSAYNSVNGNWCGENSTLLTDILRTEWGWDGFVVSDFIFGLRNAIASVEAGLDIEMPFRQQRAIALPDAIERGDLTVGLVDAAVERIVATLLRFSDQIGRRPPIDVVGSTAHRGLAREAAVRSTVMLRNEGALLPVDVSTIGSVAVLGRLAARRNLGDGGSSDVKSSSVVTPLDGLRTTFGADRVVFDETDATIAAGTDLVIVVVGYTKDDEGEYIDNEGTGALIADLFPPMDHPELGSNADMDPFAPTGRAHPDTTATGSGSGDGAADGDGDGAADGDGDGAADDGEAVGDGVPDSAVDLSMAPGGDRASLRLSDADEALIAAALAVSSNVVVVVVSGSAVVMPWADGVPAVLQTWYSGVEGGSALADIIGGHAEPGGRLPFAVPHRADHLAPFDRTATSVVYDLFHGQWKLDRDGVEAHFPFGWGLGYVEANITAAQLSDDRRSILATVSNHSERATSAVVFVHAGLASSKYERPIRRLVGFARANVGAGVTTEVVVDVDWTQLDLRLQGTWVTEAGVYALDVGRYAHDPAAITLQVERSS
jgi:beta-glucosidase